MPSAYYVHEEACITSVKGKNLNYSYKTSAEYLHQDSGCQTGVLESIIGGTQINVPIQPSYPQNNQISITAW